MEYTTLTDSELQEIFHAANEETSRRNLITAAITRYTTGQATWSASTRRSPS